VESYRRFSVILTTPNNRFLQRVNPQITRAVADSGSSLNHSEIQLLARNMVDLGLWGNLKLWVHSGLAKERTSGSDVFASKIYDISGNEKDAAQSTTTAQAKIASVGLSFDGGDYYEITTPMGVSGATTRSVLFWIKPTAINTLYTVFAIGPSITGVRQQFVIHTSAATNGDIYVSFNNRDVSSSSGVLNTTDYHFIAVTYDGNTLSTTSVVIYRNASSLSKTLHGTLSGSANTVEDFCHIANDIYASRKYSGILDDLRLFNAVLTDTQISAIYNATKSKYGH